MTSDSRKDRWTDRTPLSIVDGHRRDAGRLARMDRPAADQQWLPRRLGGVRGMCAIVGQVGVDVSSDADGGAVVDGPQGADHVLVASKVEGAGNVDGLICERQGGDAGLAGG